MSELQTAEVPAPVAVTDLVELARLANEEHRACEEALQAGLAHALAAGEYLLRAKALIPHGGWLPWLAENFEGSERTAQAYMRVSREWPQLEEGKAQRVADLPFREAVRLLAAPSEKARGLGPLPAHVEADLGNGLTLQPGYWIRGRFRHWHGQDGTVWVFPYAPDPRFAYVNVLTWNEGETDPTASMLTGSQKPFRLDAVRWILEFEGPPAEAIAWAEPEPHGGCEYNVCLFLSKREYIDKAILGKGR